MKIFDVIRLGVSGFSGEACACAQCRYFLGDPAVVERVYRGLTAMSSGYASVRDRDGFCERHQLYLSARDGCGEFEDRESKRLFSCYDKQDEK